MSSLIMFEVYDFTHDCHLGDFHDYDEAEVFCDEYVANYGEPVEALVQPSEFVDTY